MPDLTEITPNRRHAPSCGMKEKNFGMNENHCPATERFQSRISNLVKTNYFDSALDLEQTLIRYVHRYNTQLPQSALRSRTPIQAIKDWHKVHPHRFVKSPRNYTRGDNQRSYLRQAIRYVSKKLRKRHEITSNSRILCKNTPPRSAGMSTRQKSSTLQCAMPSTGR